jgi:hypothetical protein
MLRALPRSLTAEPFLFPGHVAFVTLAVFDRAFYRRLEDSRHFRSSPCDASASAPSNAIRSLSA